MRKLFVKHKVLEIQLKSRPVSYFDEISPAIVAQTEEGYYFNIDHPAWLKAIGKYAAKTSKHVSLHDKWAIVKNTWEKAESFLKSVSSKITKPEIDEKTFSLRVLSCHGVDLNGNKIAEPCKARGYTSQGQYHYCNLCGCGARELARLSSIGSSENDPKFTNGEYLKLHYPYLECPLEKKGFSNNSES